MKYWLATFKYRGITVQGWYMAKSDKAAVAAIRVYQRLDDKYKLVGVEEITKEQFNKLERGGEL